MSGSATAGGAPSVSLFGAAQVARPPQDGLPYLRLDRAGELSLGAGSLACRDGLIAAFDDDSAAEVRVDATGCAVVPGFVDAHTHLPFAGWRAEEYERKVTGVPYDEIVREGGGIAASARAFAAASDDDVTEQASDLAAEMLRWGTTTFECKSGYGLSAKAELRALALAGRLDAEVAQDTTSTALLAHAVPPGRTAEDWFDEVERLVPRVAAETAAGALDVFVESFAFSNDHLRRMGELATAHGLALRCHVEQFETHHSVPVALAVGARSVDHLSCLDCADLPDLAASECAAVLLPGAEFMGAEHAAPGRALADAGAVAVLATDANPGTSPIVSMPTIVGLAVRRYGWSAREALVAATLNAAWTLGLSRSTGSLEAGKRADVLLLDGPLEHVAYRFGHNPVQVALVGGQPAWVRPDAEWRLRR